MRTKRNTVREFTTNRLHEQVSEFWNENWMDLYDAKILWHDAMVATCWMRWLQSDTILNWTINYILDLMKLPGRMNWHDRFQNSIIFENYFVFAICDIWMQMELWWFCAWMKKNASICFENACLFIFAKNDTLDHIFTFLYFWPLIFFMVEARGTYPVVLARWK